MGRAGGSTGSKVIGRRPSERCLGRTGASQEGNLRKGAASGSPGPRPPWAVKEGRWSEGTTPPSSSSPDAGSRKPPRLPGAAKGGRWSEGTTPPSSSSPDAGSRKPPGLPGAAGFGGREEGRVRGGRARTAAPFEAEGLRSHRFPDGQGPRTRVKVVHLIRSIGPSKPVETVLAKRLPTCEILGLYNAGRLQRWATRLALFRCGPGRGRLARLRPQ